MSEKTRFSIQESLSERIELVRDVIQELGSREADQEALVRLERVPIILQLECGFSGQEERLFRLRLGRQVLMDIFGIMDAFIKSPLHELLPGLVQDVSRITV